MDEEQVVQTAKNQKSMRLMWSVAVGLFCLLVAAGIVEGELDDRQSRATPVPAANPVVAPEIRVVIETPGEPGSAAVAVDPAIQGAGGVITIPQTGSAITPVTIRIRLESPGAHKLD